MAERDYELTELDGGNVEVLAAVPSTALESITRGEIDSQIATAKRYPRDLTQFKKRSLAMVSMDEETAESCLYRRPVGKKPNGEVEYAEGVSVRMAEIVVACYGNLRYGAMVIDQTPERVVCRGFCHDVEMNIAAQSEAVESTLKKNGQPFSPAMRVVVAKAALAKARRDAVFQVVPRAMVKFLEMEARRVVAGNGLTLRARIDKAVKWVQSRNIDPKRVWAALGAPIANDGFPELSEEQLDTLTGIKSAIRAGDTTWDEAFPELNTAPPKTLDAEGDELEGTAQAIKAGQGAPESGGDGGDSQNQATPPQNASKRAKKATKPAPEQPQPVAGEKATPAPEAPAATSAPAPTAQEAPQPAPAPATDDRPNWMKEKEKADAAAAAAKPPAQQVAFALDAAPLGVHDQFRQALKQANIREDEAIGTCKLNRLIAQDVGTVAGMDDKSVRKVMGDMRSFASLVDDYRAEQKRDAPM